MWPEKTVYKHGCGYVVLVCIMVMASPACVALSVPPNPHAHVSLLCKEQCGLTLWVVVGVA